MDSTAFPTEGPAILCPNHVSFLDSAFLMLHVPRNISFVGKAEYMDSWKTKYLFPLMGMIPIDRGGGDKSQAALDTAEAVLRRGELFGIFPEGTRSRDGMLHKGRTGAARLALKIGCPIYPVGMVGTREIQPPDAKAAEARAARARSRSAGRSTSSATAPWRRPHGPAPDHRRIDVRDPRPHRTGIPQRVCRQDGRDRADGRGQSCHADRPRVTSSSALSSSQLIDSPAGEYWQAIGCRWPRRLVALWPTSRSHCPMVRNAPLPRVPPRPPWLNRSARAWPRPRSRPSSTARSGISARALPDGAEVAIITGDSEEGRHVLRHSTAHVMAQAVTQLFPGAKFSIGPAIENGFYYDFELPGGKTFSDDDLAAIEAQDGRDHQGRSAVRPRRAVTRRRAEAVRRPAVQARDHRAGIERARPTARMPARSAAARRSASTATPPTSSTSVAGRTCRRRAGSATSS